MFCFTVPANDMVLGALGTLLAGIFSAQFEAHRADLLARPRAQLTSGALALRLTRTIRNKLAIRPMRSKRNPADKLVVDLKGGV